jgi:hypothetical protein
VANQGVIHCDADGNGTNESDRNANASFTVLRPIPTLSRGGITAIVLLIVALGVLLLVRRYAI